MAHDEKILEQQSTVRVESLTTDEICNRSRRVFVRHCENDAFSACANRSVGLSARQRDNHRHKQTRSKHPIMSGLRQPIGCVHTLDYACADSNLGD